MLCYDSNCYRLKQYLNVLRCKNSMLESNNNKQYEICTIIEYFTGLNRNEFDCNSITSDDVKSKELFLFLKSLRSVCLPHKQYLMVILDRYCVKLKP